MTSQIGTTGTGGVFIGGQASGINTTALIDAAVQQRTFRADRLDIQIEENVAKVGAYQQLDDLTRAIDASLANLRGTDSLFDDTVRVWDQKAGTISTSDGSDFSGILDIAIDPEAQIGNYSIEVLDVAAVQRVASNTIADADAALGYTGTFDLGTTVGPSVNVNVTAGMSLRDVAAEINAQSGTSNVAAQIIQTSESGFQLIISGTQTAQDLSTTSTGGDDVLNLLGVTDGLGGFSNELQAASQARINFDGVEVTRNDNVLDDVVEGIELNLNNAAPGTIISLEVGNDAGAARAAIEEFINAYNAFRDFVTQNQQVSEDGVVAEDAILFGDNLLDLIANTYSNFIGGQFNSTGDIQTIRDLGIRIGSGNKLEISDSVRLDTALLNNFDAVRDAFAARADSDNAEFRLSRNEGVTPTQAIVFDITTDGAGTITGVTANGDGSAFTIDGNRVVGAEGTQYEGLRFAYIGSDTNVTINVDFNQGLSERLLNSIEPFNSINNGLLVQERASLQSINNEKAQEASEIRARAEEFRASEIDRYAKLEADISALNLLLDQIRAILGADRDDD